MAKLTSSWADATARKERHIHSTHELTWGSKAMGQASNSSKPRWNCRRLSREAETNGATHDTEQYCLRAKPYPPTPLSLNSTDAPASGKTGGAAAAEAPAQRCRCICPQPWSETRLGAAGAACRRQYVSTLPRCNTVASHARRLPLLPPNDEQVSLLCSSTGMPLARRAHAETASQSRGVPQGLCPWFALISPHVQVRRQKCPFQLTQQLTPDCTPSPPPPGTQRHPTPTAPEWSASPPPECPMSATLRTSRGLGAHAPATLGRLRNIAQANPTGLRASKRANLPVGCCRRILKAVRMPLQPGGHDPLVQNPEGRGLACKSCCFCAPLGNEHQPRSLPTPLAPSSSL